LTRIIVFILLKDQETTPHHIRKNHTSKEGTA